MFFFKGKISYKSKFFLFVYTLCLYNDSPANAMLRPQFVLVSRVTWLNVNKLHLKTNPPWRPLRLEETGKMA